MARTVNIGQQDFEKIITNNYFYVDKTSFIKEWWEKGDVVTLITRPWRFGKTLTMSMVEQFFSVRYAGRGELFQNLTIWQDVTYQELQGTYPVISLSFAKIKEADYQTARDKICQLLVTLYSQNSFLLESSVLREKDKEHFRRVLVDMDDCDASIALERLSAYLYQYYGKKVIILLDEYDTPMQQACMNGYKEQMEGFLGSLFLSTFKTNSSLERAIMMGTVRIYEGIVTSNLNHLSVVTTTTNRYVDCFGFTQEEVNQALEEYGITDQREEIQDWYGGFVFGSRSGIYNPWSIINYLDKKVYRTYWANTCCNSLIGKLLRESSADVKMKMEDLLAGKGLHMQMDEQIVFSQIGHSQSAIWSLLLASGYLKVQKFVINVENGRAEYDLALTNKEVRIMFAQMIRGWFADMTPAYDEFIKALLAGNREAMNTDMNRTVLVAYRYFDTGKRIWEEAEPERFYHGFVLGLMVELADRYQITSNRESGFGRYDVLLWPKNGREDAIILECKVRNPEDEKDLEETALEALAQIERMKYVEVLEEGGVDVGRIRKYGVAFEGKRVLIR